MATMGQSLAQAAVLLGAISSSLAFAQEGAKPAAAAAKDFAIEGYYVEACTCRMPCPCELTGIMDGCKGVGAYQISKGTYDGADFSGARLAYALHLGQAVVVYVDAPDDKRDAAAKFARAAFAMFGPIKAVKNAKIEIKGEAGKHTVSVDGGKAMKFETEPVMGGDKKTAIVHNNTNSLLNPTMYQGACVSCTFEDEGLAFTVPKGRNVYFNAKLKTTGKT